MTEIERLENQLYKKYIEIKKKKRKELKVSVKSHQEERMFRLADETGAYFDPDKYWNEKRLQQLKDAVNKRFTQRGYEEQSIQEAVDLFCNEMNANSQFYEVSVKKVKKGDYKNASNSLKANQLKYGYHFEIKPKKTEHPKVVTNSQDNRPLIDDKKLADEILKKNLESLAKYRKKLAAIQEKVKQSVNDNLDKKVKNNKRKFKPGQKLPPNKVESISKDEMDKILKDVRDGAFNLSGEADLDLHQSEYIQFYLNQAKSISEKTSKSNVKDRVYNVSLPKESYHTLFDASPEIVEAVEDAYLNKKNELAEQYELDDDDYELDSWVKPDAIWEDDDPEADSRFENDLKTLQEELDKETAAYFEKNRRDLIYVMEHARDAFSSGFAKYKYPLLGTYIDENGIKQTTHTTLIDVNYIGFGSKSKKIVESAKAINNSPTAGLTEDLNLGVNIDPHKPVVKVSEVIEDGTSTGEVLEQVFLNGFLAISDGDRYPELKQQQKSIANMREVQTHYTEVSHEFGIHERQESELQIFLNWIKEIFGDNWKNILNTYNYSDLKRLQENGETSPYSERVEESITRRDITAYQKQLENFANGTAENVAREAQKEARRLYNQATAIANLKSKTPLHFNISGNKTKVVRGISEAMAIVSRGQKPAQTRTTLTPKSGQQILGDQLFHVDYIQIEKAPTSRNTTAKMSSPTNYNYEVKHNVAEKTTPPVKRIIIRKSGLKPFLLPKKAIKDYFVRSNYGDVLAACFFQILVSNTPIDEPYSGVRKRRYFTSKRVSSYKDIEVNGIQVKGVNKTAEEIFQEKEASRQEKFYYEYFEHIPDRDVVRNDWEFIYKGKVFKPTDSEFSGCFDKKADYNSIKKIQTVFKTYSFNSKTKSISFSYYNTNPRWEQLEYGGYVQNDNSGPWKGEGKYGFLHGVKDHFTYQAPNGWLRLIEAQWNVYMESGFDLKCLKEFIDQQGFNATTVGKELIEEFNIKPREYDYKNFKVIEVV